MAQPGSENRQKSRDGLESSREAVGNGGRGIVVCTSVPGQRGEARGAEAEGTGRLDRQTPVASG